MSEPAPGEILTSGRLIGERQGKTEKPDLRGREGDDKNQRLLTASLIAERSGGNDA